MRDWLTIAEDALMIHLRVVQAVQQVDRPRSGRGHAHPDFAGEFSVGAGHEGRHLLVAHLHESDVLLGALQSPQEPVDAIAGIAIDAAHTSNR